MAEVVACSDAQALERFALGLLPPDEAGALAEHVLGCPRCVSVLDTVSGRDTFLEALAGTAPAETPAEPVQRLIDELSRQRPARPGDATVDYSSAAEESVADAPAAEETLDFLGPAQLPDELGRLGAYRILKVLGKGGMGMVLLAEDTKLDRLAALKVMLPRFAEAPGARQRFLREAKSAAALKHDHIITIYQVDEHRGVPFLAMEYLEGQSLDQWLKAGAQPSIAEIVHIGREVGEGLAAAHARGLIHRDIKPGNIWLEGRQGDKETGRQGDKETGEGDSGSGPSPLLAVSLSRCLDFRVKILDFGLARAQADDVNLTQSGMILGTPAYMAPEQAQPNKKVDHRADLFSLGCVLYRLCTGTVPFPGDSTMSILMALATQQPAAPHSLNAEVPHELSELVMRLLEKDPANRVPSAQEVVKTLRDIEQRLAPPIAAPAPVFSVQSTPAVEAEPSQPEAATVEAPAPGAGQAAPQRSGRRVAVRVALLTALTAAMVAGIVILIPAPKGTLRIQIDDPQIEVAIKGQDIVLKHEDKDKDITVKAGKQLLEIRRGTFTFETDKLILKKGDRVTVDVRLIGEKIRLVHDGQPLAEARIPDYALDFDGVGDYVEVPSLELNCGQPLTIEVYATPRAYSEILQAIVSQDGGLTGLGRQDTDVKGAWTARVRNKIGRSENNTVQLDRRVHLACVWDDNECRLFLDGKEQKKLAGPSNWEGRAGITIGAHVERGGKRVGFFNGLIDEVRISKSARYQQDFVPAKRFVADADTLALYHFDEGQGETLIDSSGNGHHGKIVGAEWVRAEDIKPFTPGTFLSFTDNNTVTMPSLTYDGSTPLTLEGWFRIQSKDRGRGRFPLQLPAHLGPFCITFNWPGAGYQWGAVGLVGRDSDWTVWQHRAAPPQLDQWVHVAGQWDGKLATLFINGRPRTDFTAAPALGLDPKAEPVAAAIRGWVQANKDKEPLTIGDPKPQSRFFGDVAQLRISKTIRYRSFFVPSVKLPNDGDTIALYHLDEGQGEVLKDSSGNGHDGKIVGAKWVSGNQGSTAPAGAPPAWALEFDGKSSYVELPPMPFDPTKGLTLEANVLPLRDAPVQNLIQSSDGVGGMGLAVNSEAFLGAALIPADARGVWYGVGSKSRFRFGAWTHLAMVFDGKNFRLFHDGRETATYRDTGLGGAPWKEFPGLARPSSGSVFVGGKNHFFKGRIRGLRISSVPRYRGDFKPPDHWEPDEHTLSAYRFDEGQGDRLTDCSGNDRHGKIVGANWVKADAGLITTQKTNFALQFDGKSSRVQIPRLSIPADCAVTMEAWVRVKDLTLKSPNAAIIRCTSDRHYSLHLWNSGDFGFAAHDQKGTAIGTTAKAAGDVSIHLAGVWDGTQSHLFIQGRRVGTMSTNGGPILWAAGASLGANQSRPGDWIDFFSGTIDEVRISKVARYQADFTPMTRFESEQDTVALYHCDEGQGEVLIDSSGNGHHGKIVGAKWVKVDPRADAERDFALWALAKNVQVTVEPPGEPPISSADKLPAAPFRVVGLFVPGDKFGPFGDAEMPRLVEATHLVRLGVGAQPLTDAGVRALLAHPNLQNFSMLSFSGSSKVTDDSIGAILPRATSLRELNLSRTRVSDEGLREVGRLTRLEDLDLRYTTITARTLERLPTTVQKMRLEGCQAIDDAALVHLKKQTRLKELALGHTAVTAKGVKQVSDALPQCGIKSDHGTFGP